ncbi:hypothetical protein PM10SUCC1_14720 [Propionigenium maris DSM 9537]|uniref:Uncharacterized protein n=1 Tax=Propionigenium maris DSM 9537 TaxID=1123000 RepID=A0A9W6GIT2_9FUSO|nr:hypothetical protein [Propionigenium maris]GLI55958.1 hypothetical protein PM10SUCC1_14720 [Propionigenium maris DSM 9537]
MTKSLTPVDIALANFINTPIGKEVTFIKLLPSNVLADYSDESIRGYSTAFTNKVRNLYANKIEILDKDKKINGKTYYKIIFPL